MDVKILLLRSNDVDLKSVTAPLDLINDLVQISLIEKVLREPSSSVVKERYLKLNVSLLCLSDVLIDEL